MKIHSIPLDKVQSEIAKIDLYPKLEELLGDYSDWFYELLDGSYVRQHDAFHDFVGGTEAGILYEFLTENNIGIRPSGFEFYLIEEESDTTEESEQTNWSEVIGQK